MISASSGLGEVYGLVAVGQNTNVTYTDDVITTSPDGITWTTRSLPSMNSNGTYLTDVAWSSSYQLWVAVGTHRPGFPGNYQKFFTSPDGINWTQRDIPTPFYALSAQCVIWIPEVDLFLAGGNLTTSLGYSFLSSPDGITWTASGGNTGANFNVEGISYSPELERALGVFSSAQTGEYSTNQSLTSWSITAGGITTGRSTIWVSSLSLFIVVGYGASVSKSSTGLFSEWTQVAAPETANWESVAYSPTLGRMVAVASSATVRVMYSSDGTTWSNTSVSGGGTRSWKSVTWSTPLSKFIAVGGGGWTMSSSDGITWTQTQSSVSIDLNGVNWGLISA